MPGARVWVTAPPLLASMVAGALGFSALAAKATHRSPAADEPTAAAPSAETFPAAPQRFGKDRKISSGGSDYEMEPSLAVHRSQVVVAFRTLRGASSRVGVSISRDGGNAFSAPFEPFPTSALGQTDPAVAVDARGLFHLVWAEYSVKLDGRFSRTAIFSSRSDDGGRRWTPPRELAQGGEDLVLDKPWVIAGDRGLVLVTYLEAEKRVRSSQIRWMRSMDRGLAFHSQGHISVSGRATLAQPALSNLGDVYLAWIESSSGTSDAGWKVLLSASRDRGATFSPPVRVDAEQDAAFDVPVPAARDNWVGVAYTRNRVGGREVCVARSGDGGRSFEARWRSKEIGPASQFHPWLVAASDGVLHLLWFHDRLGRGVVMHAAWSPQEEGGTEDQVSSDGFPVTAQGFGEQSLGDYLALASDAKRLYAAWTDPREGKSHIYFARAPPGR